MDDPKDLDVSVQELDAVDPGLALLPIVAILCGVAIGLGTVALGVILIVRGRHDELELDEHSGDEDGSLVGINRYVYQFWIFLKIFGKFLAFLGKFWIFLKILDFLKI
jgi:hypothetical protein